MDETCDKTGGKSVRLKARAGRGSKRQALIQEMNFDLRQEFDRLRKIGVKFNLTTLRHLSLDIIETSDADVVSGGEGL